MTISRSTSLVNGVMFVLICCVALLVWNLYRNVEDNIRMNRQKEVALQLANELMQSSEQLTNNVREYAVTGDDRYEKIYLAIVDERAGKIPRSQSKSVAPGRTVSLTDLMRENGFTEQEFALVKQANDLSNALVVLETKAMNAVKGITTAPDGSEVRGKPDLALARSLVFGADYKSQTDKIMQPLLVVLDPSDEPAKLVAHRGQEFNFVLKGTVKVILGDHELILEEGDSLYFDPRMSHVQLAVGGPATFLTVINEQATAYGNPTILDPKKDWEHTFKD